MLKVLENFMGYSNQKAEKNFLSRSEVISILIKCIQKRENRNIELHALKLG
jgi:hypothetical protein